VFFGRPVDASACFGAADFRFARKEDEDALLRLVQRAVDGADGIGRNGLALRLVEVARLHGEDAARRIDDGGIAQMRRDPGGIERGGHDQDLQIVAKPPLDVERQRQAQIGIERAFVEFVEDDEAGAGKLRVGAGACG
jgi:hypothetical protein